MPISNFDLFGYSIIGVLACNLGPEETPETEEEPEEETHSNDWDDEEKEEE